MNAFDVRTLSVEPWAANWRNSSNRSSEVPKSTVRHHIPEIVLLIVCTRELKISSKILWKLIQRMFQPTLRR